LFGRLDSLLDTTPLRKLCQETIDRESLRSNIASGSVAGVALVATTCPVDGSGGRSRIFYQAADGIRPNNVDPKGALDYVETFLTAEHILASAAIPVAFPAVLVSEPQHVAGYYCDGGVRLNTPIDPALQLGAKRLVIVSSHANEYPHPTSLDERRDIIDGIAQMFHVMQADGLIEDLRRLRRINLLVRQARESGISLMNHTVCPPKQYEEVPFVEVAPRAGALRAKVRDVLNGSTKTWSDRYRRAEYSVLRWLIGGFGRGPGNDELLSYLLFNPNFAKAQIALGREDAKRRLASVKVQAAS
jgi:NTE family protein